MIATLKLVVPIAALTLAMVTLGGCVVVPADPYYGGGAYYTAPAPVYVGPSYYYGLATAIGAVEAAGMAAAAITGIDANH